MLPPKIFTPDERKRLGRCMHCENYVPAQGHHSDCDRARAPRTTSQESRP